MENANVWEYAVKSVEEIRQRGLCGWYTILINGKNSYTGETKDDYIKAGYTILSQDEFSNLIDESERNQCNHWKEITEKEYDYALNVLPPLQWYNGGFFVSERYSGSLYDYYQKLNGKYYTSLQSVYTKREEILENLKKFIDKQENEKGEQI